MSVKQLKEQLDTLLSDYLEKGYAIYTFKPLPKKDVTASVRTISFQDQLEIEAIMKTVSENEIPLYRMHTYQIHFLSRTLLSFGKEEFATPEEAKKFLESKGIALLDTLLKRQSELEKVVREEVTVEDLENFTQAPTTSTD